jgi:hypothetical protein
MLATLLALRYKLMWAQVRTRNGKIAVFLAGYFLVILVVVLLALGGFGAAVAAIHAGKAELVARVAFGSFFLNLIMAAFALGFGVNQTFSEATLRRYPLNSWERLAGRHLTALLEPSWFFGLALYLGLATGFYVFGTSSLGLGLVTALFLIVANYLCARVLIGIVEWLIVSFGPMAVLALLMVVALGPSLFSRWMVGNRGAAQIMLAIVQPTPPFAAAAVVGGGRASALLLLIGWCVGLVILLFGIERLPVRTRRVTAQTVKWDGPFDRLAAMFGPTLGPLATKFVRFYFRSPHVKFNYPFAVPLLGFIVFSQSRGSNSAFLIAAGAIGALGFLCSGALALNAFGFDRGGFSRYLLCPAPLERVLRTASFVSLVFGGLQIPVAALAWWFLGPVKSDARMMTMLVSDGVTGLFLFHGLGIWTSVMAPRALDFYQVFGNKLSVAANVVMIAGIIIMLGVPQILSATVGVARAIQFWWIAPLLAMGAIVFYVVSLRLGARAFAARKESMLALIAGRG